MQYELDTDRFRQQDRNRRSEINVLRKRLRTLRQNIISYRVRLNMVRERLTQAIRRQRHEYERAQRYVKVCMVFNPRSLQECLDFYGSIEDIPPFIAKLFLNDDNEEEDDKYIETLYEKNT